MINWQDEIDNRHKGQTGFFKEIDMKNDMKTRVIKKNGRFYPQYKVNFLFSKKWKWKPFTYEVCYYMCRSYADTEELEHFFKTRLEALHFIKKTI